MNSDGYALDQCGLYSIRTRKRLYKVLQRRESQIEKLLATPDLYRSFEKKKLNGDVRQITAPCEALKTVQARISDLLMRVGVPGYIFAPVRGRSYIQNAARHRGNPAFHLLDIEDFFPSCTVNKVAWFFTKKLNCSPDVAAILVRLTTLDGSLPQGSPSSSALAYWSYCDMWDEIAAKVHAADCTLSVFADDITLSGLIVRKELVLSVKQVLAHHGHAYKAAKEVSVFDKPILVTGVVVQGLQLLVRNKQHQKIATLASGIAQLPAGSARKSLQRSLVGTRNQMKQIVRATGDDREELQDAEQ